MKNIDLDVILACLKLSRAMRRCPPERREHPFPPAVDRLLACAAENPGVSSRELCELLDVRPSSLSEMLTRAEADGLLTRTVDEEDRRVQRISLSEKGQRIISDIETARILDAKRKTGCLTDEEKQQFCVLCDKLSEHIERLALDLPEDRRMPPPSPDSGFPHHGPEPRHCPSEPDGKQPDPHLFPIPPNKRMKC